MELLQTPEGVRYGILSDLSRPIRNPAPTLFVFAMDIERTLSDPHFCAIAHHLSDAGVLAVSVSLPCHGEDQRDGEPHGPAHGLRGWRCRLEQGEDVVRAFTNRASQVLSHLIEQGQTDPDLVWVCGTSRGGFMALHFASGEPRVGSVAAFSPVVNLADLHEFAGLEEHPLVRELDLRGRAAELSAKRVWIAIGNRDQRVNTHSSVDLARRMDAVHAQGDARTRVSLHVLQSEGHSVPDGAHLMAASWFRQLIKSM